MYSRGKEKSETRKEKRIFHEHNIFVFFVLQSLSYLNINSYHFGRSGGTGIVYIFMCKTDMEIQSSLSRCSERLLHLHINSHKFDAVLSSVITEKLKAGGTGRESFQLFFHVLLACWFPICNQGTKLG